MISVLTTTGAELVVGDRTFSPTEPTLVESVTPEMGFYRDLLRMEEVDEHGNPLPPDEATAFAPPVSAEEHAEVLRQRDDSDAKFLAENVAKETALRDLATVKSAKEAVETKLVEAERERDHSDSLLEKANVELAKHQDDAKAAADKVKTDHDALVAKHKGEVEKLKTDHKSEIDKLKEAHKAEIEKLKKPS